MRKSESFFSIEFRYSKQTTVRRWPVLRLSLANS